MSRTYKKEYTGIKKSSQSCRNHGACSYSRDDRLYSGKNGRQAADDEVLDYYHRDSEKGVDSEG